MNVSGFNATPVLFSFSKGVKNRPNSINTLVYVKLAAV